MINIFQPSIPEESIKNLEKVFQSNWLGRGKYVQEFESNLCDYLNIKSESFHTVSSCSDAIFGAFKAFKFPAGSKVLIPTNSFPAIPAAILNSNLIPVIVDISLDDGNILIDELNKTIVDEKIVAIFITDYGGLPCNVPHIKKIVGDSVKIFIDSAGALGTFINNEINHKEADFVCWSFDAMKQLVCGEGGGVYIPDSEALLEFKSYMYLGLDPKEKSGLDKSHGNKRWWEYQINSPGRRSVFTNINAAIGLPQIPLLENKIEKRMLLKARYDELFSEFPSVKILKSTLTDQLSNYFYTILLQQRDDLANFLLKNNIYSTMRYFPIHLIEIYKKFSRECPNGDVFSNHALNIPIHDSLTEDEIKHIESTTKKFFDK